MILGVAVDRGPRAPDPPSARATRVAPTRSATSATGFVPLGRPTATGDAATAALTAARSPLVRPVATAARRDEPRRRSAAATCCSSCSALVVVTLFARGASRARRAFIALQLVADVAARRLRLPAAPVQAAGSQGQRSKVRYLGAAYRAPAPYLTRRATRRRTSTSRRPPPRSAAPDGVALSPRPSTRGPLRPDRRCRRRRRHDVLEEKHARARDHARRVTTGDPLVRDGDPRGAPARVPRGARADRGGRRVPGRGRERGRRASRRALHGYLHDAKKEFVEANLTLAFVAGKPLPDRRRARRRGAGRTSTAWPRPRASCAARCSTACGATRSTRPSGCSR